MNRSNSIYIAGDVLTINILPNDFENLNILKLYEKKLVETAGVGPIVGLTTVRVCGGFPYKKYGFISNLMLPI